MVSYTYREERVNVTSFTTTFIHEIKEAASLYFHLLICGLPSEVTEEVVENLFSSDRTSDVLWFPIV